VIRQKCRKSRSMPMGHQFGAHTQMFDVALKATGL
jgi:hypothetical protein